MIENVEQSGRKKVGDVEKIGVRVGQNIDKVYLLLTDYIIYSSSL